MGNYNLSVKSLRTLKVASLVDYYDNIALMSELKTKSTKKKKSLGNKIVYLYIELPSRVNENKWDSKTGYNYYIFESYLFLDLLKERFNWFSIEINDLFFKEQKTNKILVLLLSLSLEDIYSKQSIKLVLQFLFSSFYTKRKTQLRFFRTRKEFFRFASKSQFLNINLF